MKAVQQLLSPAQPQPVMSKERKEKVITTLLAFISRKTEFLDKTPQEEIEGYRVLRREAVAALNHCELPALSDGKTRPALVLLRLMANEGFAPEARMDERMEAAIGLARMQPEQDKNYSPDYAAQQIGVFLEQWVTYALSEQGKKAKLPYKIYSARLIEALDAMNAAAKNPYVTKVVKLALPLLDRIEKGNTNVDPLPLATLVKDEPPANGQLYKDVKDSMVKPAAE
jgi:hypothetical protein